MINRDMAPNAIVRPDAICAGPCPETEDITILFEDKGAIYQIELTPDQVGSLISQLRFSLNSQDGGQYSWDGLGEPVFLLKEDCLESRSEAK
jgi:hypothetical protein